jgi:leucine dehydrogenase
MQITELPVRGYERVLRADDEPTGLHAFIAVHSTALGPAVGGCRVWPYRSADEALRDVLRLSKGMTYKSALAETGLGGGKAVIIGDARAVKTPALLRAMGRFVAKLDGRYIAAEDVGTTTDDMTTMKEVTPFVAGLPVEGGGSGNPAPLTAFGCFRGLIATVEERFGSRDLEGLCVAVQGLGQVGMRLSEMLYAEGATLIVSDVVAERTEEAERRFGARRVSPGEIFDVTCDVLAPCGLGGILDDETIPRLRCAAVAGAANNQLRDARHADGLLARNILYAPDFVINAGGIIGIALELAGRRSRGGPDRGERARTKILGIPKVLREIYRISREQRISTDRAATELADRRLSAGSIASS